MPSADAHLHIFADGYGGLTGSSPAGGDELVVYERLRSHDGIRRGLVLGYEGGPRYAGNSDHVLSLAATRPWMAPLAYLAVSPPPSVPRLAELRSRGAVGFALYPESRHEGADRQLAGCGLCRGAAAAGARERERRARGDGDGAGPGGAGWMCRAVPAIVGRRGGFANTPRPERARELLAPLLAHAARDNIKVKFSGLYGISDPEHDFPHRAVQPFVDSILDAFGPSRPGAWGSDYSPALDFVSFAQVADTRLLRSCTKAEVHDVMGGNLLRLLDSRG